MGTNLIRSVLLFTAVFQEPQAEMFLRIEGFQVEIKEINKSWDQAIFVKNFKIGEDIRKLRIY